VKLETFSWLLHQPLRQGIRARINVSETAIPHPIFTKDASLNASRSITRPIGSF